MPPGKDTRWTLIRGAAAGLAADREEFALLYGPVARAYFMARWRNSPLESEADDAAQEVLLACFKAEGALSRADAGWSGGFPRLLPGHRAQRRPPDRAPPRAAPGHPSGRRTGPR